jgi:hypothetical protein
MIGRGSLLVTLVALLNRLPAPDPGEARGSTALSVRAPRPKYAVSAS